MNILIALTVAFMADTSASTSLAEFLMKRQSSLSTAMQLTTPAQTTQPPARRRRAQSPSSNNSHLHYYDDQSVIPSLPPMQMNQPTTEEILESTNLPYMYPEECEINGDVLRIKPGTACREFYLYPKGSSSMPPSQQCAGSLRFDTELCTCDYGDGCRG